MVCVVLNIICCLSTVQGCEHNWLLRYIMERNNLPLLIMVAVLYCVTFLKLFNAYGIHYTVTILACFYYTVTIRILFLVLKICKRAVFFCIWVLKIWCRFLYYTLTIAVYVPMFNDTRMVEETINIQVWGPITVWWCPYLYGDFAWMGTNIYIFI